MDRRRFLRFSGFITASVATLGGLSACGGGHDDDDSSGTPPPSSGPQPAAGMNWKFPQSVASGDPKPDGIVLWTRVVPANVDDTGAASADASFSIRLRVSDADNASSLGTQGPLAGRTLVDAGIPVSGTFDCTVRHKITGLAPGQTYYYQFMAGGVRSRVGRFKTAPALVADVAQLKFAFISCQDWRVNHWGAFVALAAEGDLDFVVHVGDYIYETTGQPILPGTVESAHAALALPDGTLKSSLNAEKYATSLDDYRYLYKAYRTDARLQALHERLAVVATWDDHEFSDDCWADAETYDGDGDGVEQHQPARRRNANRAWFEFMPADVVFDEQDRTDFFNIRLYRDLRFGKLAHLVMTDERLYRSDHVLPESTVNPLTATPTGSIGTRFVVPASSLAAAEAQKMALAGNADPLALTTVLGGTQRAWWQDTLKQSQATWKLWGNEVSLLRMRVDGTNAIATLAALQAVSALSARILAARDATAGGVPAAAAIVAAVTAGASQSTAAAAAAAIALADSTSADKMSAATFAGLSTAQAQLAVLAFDAAKAAAAAGPTAQADAAAQAIAFGFIKPDVIARKQDSIFIPADRKASLAPYFQSIVLNADQWDGFNAERKALMGHLVDNGIRNVVALTGDVHAFFAGTVNDDHDAPGGGTPVMVDLVGAGISSESLGSSLRKTFGALAPELSLLVFQPIDVTVPSLGGDPVSLNVGLLDHTLALATVTPVTVAESLRVQLRSALAARGVPEAQLDATADTALAALQSDPTFVRQIVPMCQQLAGMNNNPWLKYVNSDAQGYAVVTLTPAALQCDFKQVNALVGDKAPGSVVAKLVRATVQRDTAAVTVTAL